MAAEPWRVPERLWRELEPLLPKVERRFRYPGRKRVDDRVCLEGILYVLRYGIPWRALPKLEGLPSGQTCWRRLDEWERAGVWAALLLRCSSGSPRRSGSTGRGRSSMPRWSTRRGGRAGRTHAPRPPRQPLPPSGRCQRRPSGRPACGRQRERAAPSAAADRRVARPRSPPRPGVGRPRLRRRGATGAAARAGDRTQDQQTTPPGRPAPGGLTRGLAWPQTGSRKPPTQMAASAGRSNAPTPGYITGAGSVPAGNGGPSSTSRCSSSPAR
jgi:transposase